MRKDRESGRRIVGALRQNRRSLLKHVTAAVGGGAVAGCLSSEESVETRTDTSDRQTGAGGSNAGLSAGDKRALDNEFGPGTRLKRYLGNAEEEYENGDVERAAYKFRLAQDAIATTLEADGSHKYDGLAGQLGNFFVQASFFKLFHLVKENEETSVPEDHSVREIAEAHLQSQGVERDPSVGPLGIERGPNNRPFHYALARAYAWTNFRESPSAEEWRIFADAVFHDWFDPGDSYEPGYVEHNIGQVIELGEILGKDEELRSEKILQTYYRYRDHISPSGLAVTPGDGFPYQQVAYADPLKRMAELTEDSTLLWAAQQARLAGSLEAGGRVPSDQRSDVLAAEFEEFRDRGIDPERPDHGPSVQYLHPETHENPPDRLLLADTREEGEPYAGFYLNDMAETLHHAHEDNRGQLYHWEVDGNLLMFHQGWTKWPSHHNTLVIGEATEEFPHRRTTGIEPDQWHRASANTQLMRHYTPTENYHVANDIHPRESYITSFVDQEVPVGRHIENPEVYSGACDQQDVDAVTLRFATFPEGNNPGRFAPARNHWAKNVGWYAEPDSIAPADGPVDVIVRDLRLAGPEGVETIAQLDAMPGNVEVIVEPPAGEDAPEDPADEMLHSRERRLSAAEREEILEVVQDPENPDQQALQITCRPGRTDVVLNDVEVEFDAAEEYRRIEMDYYYGEAASEFLRPPMRIVPRSHGYDNCCRSMYVDRAQGGVLRGATTDRSGSDTYGRMAYTGVYTHDTDWTRRTILTEEGYLLVQDDLQPGETADGMVGGPIWNLPNPPESGVNWFDADATHPQFPRHNPGKSPNYLPEGEVNVCVYFAETRGQQYGVQFQDKDQEHYSYATHAKTQLAAGESEQFLTVLAPHDPSLDAGTVAESIVVDRSSQAVSIGVGNDNLTVTLGEGDDWTVSR